MRDSSVGLGRLPLHAFAEIDPETLSPSTPAGFSFKYIDISAVSEGKLTIPRTSTAFSEAPSRARRVLRAGDVIMSTVRPNLKAFAYCDLDEERYVASTGFAVLRAKESADPYFLLCAVLSNDVTTQIESFAVGSNYPAINSSDVRRLLIPAHALPAQRRIAKILSCIDTAIEKTEALIAKHQQIKAGLMYDLFTRGVLPNGQLRPPRSEAPELYQETAVGWIPADWELNKIDKVASVIDPNPSHRNPIYHEEGFPFISTVEFLENDEVETDTPRRVIREIVEEQEARCCFSSVSIGFSRKGTIGEIRFLPTGLRFALLDSLCVINPRNVDARFLFFSLRSSAVRTQIQNYTMGQALQQVSIGRVRDLQIACPCEIEQIAIAVRLQAISDAITKHVMELRKLKAKKLGLMQDLLTGRVPVPVPAEPAGAAA